MLLLSKACSFSYRYNLLLLIAITIKDNLNEVIHKIIKLTNIETTKPTEVWSEFKPKEKKGKQLTVDTTVPE